MSRKDDVAHTVAKALPAVRRPRLSTLTEEKFADIEQRSAVAYAEIETVTEDLAKLARNMKAEDREIDGVPLLDEDWEDTSLVHHMQELHNAAKPQR